MGEEHGTGAAIQPEDEEQDELFDAVKQFQAMGEKLGEMTKKRKDGLGVAAELAKTQMLLHDELLKTAEYKEKVHSTSESEFVSPFPKLTHIFIDDRNLR